MSTSMTERRRSSKASCVPPTEPVKSVSPVKTASPSTTKESIPRVCPGVRSASIRRSPGLDHLAVAERLGALDLLLRRREDAQPEAVLEQAVVGDVVGVRVRRQQVRGVHVEPLDGGEQGLDRGAGVDEDGGSAGPVGDQVGVREPPRIHAPLDDHGAGSMPAEGLLASRGEPPGRGRGA